MGSSRIPAILKSYEVSMSRIESALNPRAAEYVENRLAMQALVAELEERLAVVRAGGGERGAAKFRAAGKLLPRERVELLLDPGTPFLELSPLAAWDMYDGESPGASQITGIGVVSGTECLIVANDATVKGGAVYPMTVHKSLRAQAIAAENHLPCITLVESAGANLLFQAEFFADIGGRGFANQARMSAAGIPQIALVFGSSTAGGAYVPGMSDYVVMVRDQARVFLGGPPLVKMATGEVVDDETLGGATMHGSVSGVSDYTASDDADALRIGREIVAQLNRRKLLAGRRRAPEQPHYDPDELLGVIPANPRVPFDMREVIARIVDGSRFFEFKRDYGPTLVAGHAHLDGYPVGILANNGVLFSECALKAAQFIQLCNQSRTPIIYLQNITGFMVGTKYEREGIIKHGSKMVNAVATSTVPQFTVIVGGSYGAGNYGMCGRAYSPRLLFMWPGARISVMGGEQAATVMTEVGQPEVGAQLKEQYDEQGKPWFSTARIWDDGVIDPRETRDVLSQSLAACACAPLEDIAYGVFRM
jgi:3-methylcrotonyl-CoA carboxylase beta subunit